jgi:hypothetical protein
MGDVTVFARPDRLRRFRVTAGALADGLAVRAAALEGAVDAYRLRTERAFEVDARPLVDAVRALGLTVRELGDWVGQVGDAFASLPALGGVALGSADDLRAALPAGLRFGSGATSGAGGPGGSGWARGAVGFTVQAVVAGGVDARDLRAVASVIGSGTRVGGALAGAADHPAAMPIGRFLDVGAAAAAGAAETHQRWVGEPDRPAVERGARAALDGALAAAGSYGGAAAGAWAGGTVCAPVPAVAPACAAVGARAGGWAGSNAAEAVSDLVLGDEAEPWERDPAGLAREVADIDHALVDAVAPFVEEAAGTARAAADRHADFVVDHPWLWDDGYAGVPATAPPPAAADVPSSGPR